MRPIGQKLELDQSNGYYMKSFCRFSENNHLWAIVLLVVILIDGFYSQVFRFAFGIPENLNIFLVYWFAFSACLSAWVYADMRFRGIPIYFDQGFSFTSLGQSLFHTTFSSREVFVMVLYSPDLYRSL